jgi:hypothetical protein
VVLLTVNLVISFIRERAGVAGDVIAGIAGVAWGLVTFLVVPVIALEGLGPWASVKRSGALFRQRWGEQISGNFAIGGIFVLVGLIPAVIIGAIGWVSDSDAVRIALIALALVIAAVAVILARTLGLRGRALPLRGDRRGDRAVHRGGPARVGPRTGGVARRLGSERAARGVETGSAGSDGRRDIGLTPDSRHCAPLVADDLDEPAPLARAVELDEEDPLPGAEAELAVAQRQRLTGRPHQERHAVRVAVAELDVLRADVLGAEVPVVVSVVLAGRDEPAEQPGEVLEQARLELVHADAARRVWRVDADDAVGDPALLDALLDLFGDVADLETRLSPHLMLGLEDLHLAVTLLTSPSRTPAANRNSDDCDRKCRRGAYRKGWSANAASAGVSRRYAATAGP